MARCGCESCTRPSITPASASTSSESNMTTVRFPSPTSSPCRPITPSWLPRRMCRKKWEDLLDPKWKGKLGVINSTHHFGRLAAGAWGDEKTLDFIKKLVRAKAASDPRGRNGPAIDLGRSAGDGDPAGQPTARSEGIRRAVGFRREGFAGGLARISRRRDEELRRTQTWAISWWRLWHLRKFSRCGRSIPAILPRMCLEPRLTNSSRASR